MAQNDRLRKVLSLSAASIALMQSAVLSKGQSSEPISQSVAAPNIGVPIKTDGLILEPPQKLALLYADHSSHASHSSHVSGTTDSGGYDYTAPAAPTYPSTPLPPPPPPPPQTEPQFTNYLSQSGVVGSPSSVATNTDASTNSDSGTPTATQTATIQALTEAAAKGSQDAQLALGLYYRDGTGGVKKNTDRAKMLLEMSAIQGNAFAKVVLEDLEPSQTPTNSPAKP